MAHVCEEHRLHLGGFFGLALCADEFRRLHLELAGLLLRLSEQLLGPKVALQHLETHADDGQQLVEQSLLPGGEQPEGGDLEHAEERIAGFRGQGRRLHGRRLAETGSYTQVAGGKIRER